MNLLIRKFFAVFSTGCIGQHNAPDPWRNKLPALTKSFLTDGSIQQYLSENSEISIGIFMTYIRSSREKIS